ncbi:SusC/RagA family TonB-linked outer membrane protein [Aequorivita capsosiphonis]|uniref:SusC/RagA family TonB-linked outer membrane protein n=1 Tax=Aequorivita capsosiphonis TaxID=487317 RepID=UPI0003F733BB|nr:SusC/RagA family TonB-linked outer membrane protein [Aequorivita capsosiphonis]
MKIKLITVLAFQARHLPKIILRTMLFLSCTAIFGFSSNSLNSQNPKITIDHDRTVSIYEVFEIIGKQTECTFIYQSDIFKDLPKIELKKGTIKVSELLEQCLPPSKFNITATKDNYLTITRRISKAMPQGKIQGVVTDSLGIGLAGVNILVKNTSRGTQSDMDGHYEISANNTDTIVFSYLGYKLQELAVGNKTILNVTMLPDATALDQVVINAGYYKVTDREKTGSISRITAEDIENQPVNNPLEAMQGRLSGVDITPTSGIPGSGFNVRIRGQNSIMAGNEPLYIIDGIPYDSQTLGSDLSSGAIIPRGIISPLNAINPASIASIEILKDADATAIYGSRGANGVVLITTKKGKAGRTQFSFGNSTGIAHITKKRALLKTEQYIEMRREAFANDGITTYPETAYDINGTWNINRYTDWQEVLIGNTANSQKVQGSISGGSERTSFLLAGIYQNETSVYPGNFNYDRISFNTNIQHRNARNNFKMDFNAVFSLEDNLLPSNDLTFNALKLAPNAPALYDEDGTLNWEDGTWTNPVAPLEGEYKNDALTLFSSLVLSYEITSGLELKLNSGYGINQLKDHVTSPHTAFNPAYGMTSANSMVTINEGNKNNWILEPQLHWERKFGNAKLNILLGSTFQKQQYNKLGIYGIGFQSDRFINNLSAATTILVNSEEKTQYNTQSWFARINYAHKDKVFLNLTGRRDGSSRFGPGNKYGNFGALGAAYIFSEDLQIDWLSFGKLRGSYGITGNDKIGDYQYLQTYTITGQSYDGNIGLEPSRLYNPNFQWEQNNKSELALETGFFKNSVMLSVAHYNNRSSNQLINYSLPTTTGFKSILANLDAKVENKGWEFDLKTVPFQTADFKWTTSLNLSLLKNKLLEFPGLETSPYSHKYVIGSPLAIVKLYKLTGVNPQTGLFEFEDYNNDGQITASEDREYIADFTPKYYGGFSNSLSYKNWDLDIFFQFVKKKGYNQYRTTEPAGTLSNQPATVMDRWQQDGDLASMQRFTSGADPEAFLAYYQFLQSSGTISDASFIRLKSMTVAYTLNMGKENNSSCRLFLSGQNLLTFTKFKGGDPEQMDGFLPPLTRLTLGFLLNI